MAYYTNDKRILGSRGKIEQQICSSLFSWINDGSHNFADDLYMAAGDTTVSLYLAVFKEIFHSTNHGAHYEIMMEPEEASPGANGAAAAIAAELVTEVVAMQSAHRSKADARSAERVRRVAQGRQRMVRVGLPDERSGGRTSGGARRPVARTTTTEG